MAAPWSVRRSGSRRTGHFRGARDDFGKGNAAGLIERHVAAEGLDLVEIQLSGTAATAELSAQIVGHEAGIQGNEARLADAAIGIANQLTRGPATLPAPQCGAQQSVTHAAGVGPGKHNYLLLSVIPKKKMSKQTD